MRRGIWTFVLLLLTAVIGASAIPQSDLPETSYNEVDTPVNQAPPVVLGIRFTRPARAVIVMPKKTLEASWDQNGPIEEPAKRFISTRSDSQSLQNLLCTLLI